jgi:acylphosphatase
VDPWWLVTEREAIRFQVYGRVQGVGFRAFARREAQSLGLRGWVRNRPDGSVEGVAAGPVMDLSRLLDRLRRGPTYGDVAELTFAWIAADDWADFSIRW